MPSLLAYVENQLGGSEFQEVTSGGSGYASFKQGGRGRPMPIRPEHRFFYRIGWPQLSAMIRFGRAKGCCEGFGRPQGRTAYHLGDGRGWDAEACRYVTAGAGETA